MRIRGGVRLLGRIVPAVQSAFRKKSTWVEKKKMQDAPLVSYAQDHFPTSYLARGGSGFLSEALCLTRSRARWLRKQIEL